MLNVALGKVLPAFCLAGDANQDGRITVDELVAAVNRALRGCPLDVTDRANAVALPLRR